MQSINLNRTGFFRGGEVMAALNPATSQAPGSTISSSGWGHRQCSVLCLGCLMKCLPREESLIAWDAFAAVPFVLREKMDGDTESWITDR